MSTVWDICISITNMGVHAHAYTQANSSFAHFKRTLSLSLVPCNPPVCPCKTVVSPHPLLTWNLPHSLSVAPKFLTSPRPIFQPVTLSQHLSVSPLPPHKLHCRDLTLPPLQFRSPITSQSWTRALNSAVPFHTHTVMRTHRNVFRLSWGRTLIHKNVVFFF